MFGGNPTLLAVGAVPLLDIDDGIAEARRLAEAGFRALMLPARVLGASVQRRRVRPVLGRRARSSGCRSRSTPAPATSRVSCAGPGGAVINYLMGAQLDGPMVILSLSAGGALDRFPDLRIVTVETGAAWLGWIMTQADSIYVDHAMYARAEAVDAPERADPAPVRGHVHVRPGRDQQPAHHGPRHAHVGQRLPAPRRHVAGVAGPRADQFDGVPDDEVRAIVGGNAARVFGFDLAARV